MTEIDFSCYFHFKSFPPLSHTHEPLTQALFCQAFTASSSLHCAGTTHTDAPRSRSRRSPELRRSTSITIAIAPIGVDRDHRNQRDCDRDLADLARRGDRHFAGSRSRSRDRDRRDCDRDRDRDRSDRDRDRDLTEKSICPSGFFSDI